MFGNRWIKSTNFQDLCLEAQGDTLLRIGTSGGFHKSPGVRSSSRACGTSDVQIRLTVALRQNVRRSLIQKFSGSPRESAWKGTKLVQFKEQKQSCQRNAN